MQNHHQSLSVSLTAEDALPELIEEREDGLHAESVEALIVCTILLVLLQTSLQARALGDSSIQL